MNIQIKELKTQEQIDALIDFYHMGNAAIAAEAIAPTSEFTKAIKVLRQKYKKNPWEAKDVTDTSAEPEKPKKQAILQYDLEGNLVAEYPSLLQACKNTGFSYPSIKDCCLGKRESFKNFVFKFKK